MCGVCRSVIVFLIFITNKQLFFKCKESGGFTILTSTFPNKQIKNINIDVLQLESYGKKYQIHCFWRYISM